ncbi:hypothetical protein [Xenorhabdus nematophila]
MDGSGLQPHDINAAMEMPDISPDIRLVAEIFGAFDEITGISRQ